jgi:hypothetical protein
VAEGGYDFLVHPSVVIRPLGGLGIAHGSGEVCVAGTCTSAGNSDVALVLGALANYMMGSFFAGADLRLLVSDGTALVLGGHAGLAF